MARSKLTDLIIDAYAAGLIDGEGCIYLRRRSRNGYTYYVPTVRVGMAEKALPVLRLMQKHYGGSLRMSAPARDNWAMQCYWDLSTASAVRALRRWLPHLVLKREVAEVVLASEDIRQSLIIPPRVKAKWTPDALARCADLQRRVGELNAKGADWAGS